MKRQIALYVLLGAVGWARLSRAAVPDPDERDEPKKIGVIAVDTYGVAPQLSKRLRGTVLDALKAEGLLTQDLIASHAFLAGCQFPAECFTAALTRLNLDYVLLAKVQPSADSSPGKPEHDIEVRLGTMPRGLSAWGPWPMKTTCHDCSDTELTDAMRQLVTRTWKAMQRAELPPEATDVSARDRRTHGAKLVKRTVDEPLSVFDQVFLLKKAIQAGAGGSTYMQLAWVFFAYGGYEEAEDWASRAASRGEKVDAILGPMLWLTGRWDEALPVFQKLTRDFPAEVRWEKSLDELKRRIQDPRGVLGQAEMELKRGEAGQAERLARIALAAGRGTRARFVLAKATLESLSYADALAQFTAVLQFEPNNAEAIAGKKKAEDGLRKVQERRAK